MKVTTELLFLPQVLIYTYNGKHIKATLLSNCITAPLSPLMEPQASMEHTLRNAVSTIPVKFLPEQMHFPLNSSIYPLPILKFLSYFDKTHLNVIKIFLQNSFHKITFTFLKQQMRNKRNNDKYMYVDSKYLRKQVIM